MAEDGLSMAKATWPKDTLSVGGGRQCAGIAVLIGVFLNDQDVGFDIQGRG